MDSGGGHWCTVEGIASDIVWLSNSIHSFLESNVFQCKNGRCITFEKVCNLVDNCVDQSDEENCTSVFHCPKLEKCNGKVQCNDSLCDDYMDKCNNQWGMEVI